MPKNRRSPATIPTQSIEVNESTYLDFVKSVSLRGMGLDSSSSRIMRLTLVQVEQDGLSQNRHLAAQYEVIHHDNSSFAILAKFEFFISRGQEITGDIATITCDFSAAFSLSKPATKDNVTRFASNEARVVFWPYLRHFVMDMSFRMSISPILLPLTSELEQLKVEQSGSENGDGN